MIRLSAFCDEAAADLGGQIAAMQKNGIHLAEIRNIDGKNVKDFTDSEAKQYSRRLADEGIGVWAIGSPLGKTDISCDKRACMNDAERIFEIACLFDAKRVRVFSFFNAYDAKEAVFARLSDMVELANRYGLTLCHENEKNIYGDNISRVNELIKEVKGLKFIYDPANMIQVGDDPQKALCKWQYKVDYFHIKDVIKSTGELVPAGEGDGRIPELIARIKDDKTLTLEPHLKVFEGYSKIDDAKMKNKYDFRTNAEAFAAAATALRNLLLDAGYKEKGGIFAK